MREKKPIPVDSKEKLPAFREAYAIARSSPTQENVRTAVQKLVHVFGYAGNIYPVRDADKDHYYYGLNSPKNSKVGNYAAGGMNLTPVGLKVMMEGLDFWNRHLN